MKHLSTRQLETERLILRRFVVEDAYAIYKNWASDPEVTKYLMWPRHESSNTSREILREWISNYENEYFYQWAIVPRELKI